MLKKALITLALVLQTTSFCYAQATPTLPPTTVQPPLAPTHLLYDAKLRACRLQATTLNLAGDARAAFIAQCMKL
jgi:hypothetical protein